MMRWLLLSVNLALLIAGLGLTGEKALTWAAAGSSHWSQAAILGLITTALLSGVVWLTRYLALSQDHRIKRQRSEQRPS